MADVPNLTLVELTDRLAILQKLIVGTTTAFPEAPDVLTIGDLPAWINLVDEGVFDEEILGSDGILVTRTVRMILYLTQRGAGGTWGHAQRVGKPLIDAANRFFWARPALTYLPTYPALKGVRRARLGRDSGIKGIPFADEPYLGVEFPLTVEIVMRRFYAEGECP